MDTAVGEAFSDPRASVLHCQPAPQSKAQQVHKQPLTQLHLDLGQVVQGASHMCTVLSSDCIACHQTQQITPVSVQANFACQTCKACGMTYAPGDEKDEKLHAAHHQSLVQGIRFQVWCAAVVLASVGDITILYADVCCMFLVSRGRGGRQREWCSVMG